MSWTLVLALSGCASTPAPAPEAAADVQAPAAVTITTAAHEARELYDAAMLAQDNFRTVDAIAGFEQALTSDPEFALAKARLGALTPGNDGVLWLRQAAADAAAQELPEAEQTLIASILANVEGDSAKGLALTKKVTELAPGEWRAHFQVGAVAYGNEDFEAAHASMERAAALQPDAGAVWNMLGYTLAELGRTDEAVAAFQRYTEVAPGEANPHDSMAEVQMRAGRHAEAEQAFLKAVEADPSFFVGWLGVAQTRFLRGDWDGGHEAVASALEATSRTTDRVGVRTVGAWARVAQGQGDTAEADMAAAAAEAHEAGLGPQHAFNAVTLANMRILLGDLDGALTAFRDAEARLEESGAQGGAALNLQATAALGRAYVLARQGQVGPAREALPDVDALLARQPGFDPQVRMAQAALSSADGDHAAAVEELAGCGKLQHRCLHDLAAAQEAAGQVDAAQSTRQAIASLNNRSGSYLPVWMAATGGTAPDETP